MIFQFPK
jgi:hypothetical protein